MKYSSTPMLYSACLLLLVSSCKAKRHRHTKESMTSESVGSIAKEYKRLDKLCNEIEVRTSEADLFNAGNSAQRIEIKRRLQQMKLDILDLKTELKSDMLENQGFSEALFKTGLDVAIVDDLHQRIIRLSGVLNPDNAGK